MALDPDQLSRIAPRLDQEANIWFATVRADGRPHLVPIWFVFHEGKIWICTPADSQKVRNLRHNPNACAALEDGSSPVILEGTAVERLKPPYPDQLAPIFKAKYDWDFRTDDEADYILVEFTPARILSW